MKQPDVDFTAGQEIFKDYRYRGYLGKGGYGTVYHVQNAAGVSFALKVIQDGLEMEQQGFEAVRSVSSIRLVRVLDHGKTVGGKPCFLMEYVKESLATVLERTPKLEEKCACGIFKEILKGLQVLEENGIVHRDIKPANLFVSEAIVKIGDFGCAKYTSGDSTKMTRAPGSIRYMAPERFKSGYGFSVDRWAAAVIFYEMLTGKHAFDGVDDAEIFGAIMQAQPDLSLVPPDYTEFINKCFRKSVDKRHISSEEMIDAFQGVIRNSKGRDKFGQEKEIEINFFQRQINRVGMPLWTLGAIAGIKRNARLKKTYYIAMSLYAISFVLPAYGTYHNGYMFGYSCAIFVVEIVSNVDNIYDGLAAIFLNASNFLTLGNFLLQFKIRFRYLFPGQLIALFSSLFWVVSALMGKNSMRLSELLVGYWCWMSGILFVFYVMAVKIINEKSGPFISWTQFSSILSGWPVVRFRKDQREKKDRKINKKGQPARITGVLIAFAVAICLMVYHVDQINTVARKDFETQKRNPGSEYTDNGDGTATDRVTGFTWQIEGSKKHMSYEKAKKYIEQLNKAGFAGHDDWRMPAMSEVGRWLEPNDKKKKLTFGPSFDGRQWWCSNDGYDDSDQREGGRTPALSVGFEQDGAGYYWHGESSTGYVRAVRP